jgi:hypothetical protein
MAAIDIPLFLNIAGSLKDFFEAFDKNKLARNERFKTALKAVLTAVHETNLYLASMRKRKRHNLKEESRIAGLWTDAAVELLEFDKELAKKCELKGNFWSDPLEWNYKDINQVRHALDAIEYRIGKLMENH